MTLGLAAGPRGKPPLMNPRRPGPGARAVGRPRVSAVIVWTYLLAIGVSGFVYGGTGGTVLGVCFVALALFGYVSLARTRVWVDGPTLYSRTIRGYGPPIRLDRLTFARLSAFGRNNGRHLTLADADGATVVLDATNIRLARLYAALAEFIRSGDPVADERLQSRMDKYRPGLPLGI
jgi:hypothetical protein